MILLTEITKKYGKNTILDGLSYDFKEGLYIITGINGSGKSTITKIMAKIIYKTKGSLDTKSISYLPDRLSFPPLMDTGYFISLNLNIKKNEAYLLMNEYEIPKRKIGELSKGNLMKLGLLIVLAHDEENYILDEPTDGLDEFAKSLLLDKINKRLNEHKTIIIITHEPNVFSEIKHIHLVIKDGKIYEE